jgi:hypothetical protein
MYKHLIISGTPGYKGGFGEKGFPGEETYGKYFFSFVFSKKSNILV